MRSGRDVIEKVELHVAHSPAPSFPRPAVGDLARSSGSL
jgi:hypothetical protein